MGGAIAAQYGSSTGQKQQYFGKVDPFVMFAVVPLVLFTASRAKLGPFVAPPWVIILSVLTASLIIGLNLKLLFDFFLG